MNTENLLYTKINLETAPIAWKELQRFFANGTVLFVTNELDLVQVALEISSDNRNTVEAWLNDRKLSHVSDEQALNWFEQDQFLWSVVVKPWILVQEIPADTQKTVQ